MLVIAKGSPFDGIALIGPFEDGEVAGEYAERYCRNEDWWLVFVDEPVTE